MLFSKPDKKVVEGYNKQIAEITKDVMMVRAEAKLAEVRLDKAIAHMDGVDNKQAIQKRNAAMEVVKNRRTYTAASERLAGLEERKAMLTGQQNQVRDHFAFRDLQRARDKASLSAEALIAQMGQEADWDEACDVVAATTRTANSRLQDEVNELMAASYASASHHEEVQDDEVEAALREGAR